MSDQNASSGRVHRLRTVSAQQDNAVMLLKQLGADVTQFSGVVCFVRFSVGGEELLYVYNLNADNQYYLQRAKPYPMSAGVFPTTDAIAEYIENDLHAFQNAMNSGHFEAFVDLGRRIAAFSKGFEDAFLRYNITGDCFNEAQKDIAMLERVLAETVKSAQPLAAPMDSRDTNNDTP